MKAWVSILDSNGRTQLGSDKTFITKEYKTLENLIKYGVRPHYLPGRALEIDVHYSWDRSKFGSPDRVIKLPAK